MGESVTSLTRCPDHRYTSRRLRNLLTGEVRPASCRRNGCPWCGPRKALAIAHAVADAGPERWVRYSLVGDDWQTVRNRFKQNTHRLRERGYAYEVAWYVHRNPEQTGFHVHAHEHGDYIPQHEMQEVAASVGWGFPDIRAWRTGTRGTTYGLAEMLGTAYASREIRGEGMYRYLDWNGGRPVHTTRAFWRRTDGVSVSGLQSAVRASYEARFGEQVGRWVLEVGSVSGDPEETSYTAA